MAGGSDVSKPCAADLAGTTRRRRVAALACTHRVFLCVFLFVVLDGLFWVGAVPAFQTPDEPDHVVYMDRLSQQSPARPSLGNQYFSPALHDAVGLTRANAMFHQPQSKGTFDLDVRAENEARLRNMSKADMTGDADNVTRAQTIPPFHYWLGAQYYRVLKSDHDVLRNLFLPRTFSLLVALAALVAQYAAYRIYFQDEASQLLALFITALMPMYVFIHNAPNPDVMVMALFSGFLLLALRAVRDRHLGWGANFGLAAITGAGLLTKQTFAIALPTYLVLAITLLVLTRRWWRIMAQGVAYAVVLAGLAGWYYLNSTNAGRAAGTVSNPLPRTKTFAEYLDWAFHQRYIGIVDEFWGVFGWLDVSLTPRVLAAVHAVLVLSAIGIAIAALRSLLRRHFDPMVPTILTGLVALVAILVDIDYVHVSTGIEPHGFAQGRYLLPVLPVLVMLLVKGLACVVPLGRARTIMALVAVPAFATLQVIALAQTVLPRYYL